MAFKQKGPLFFRSALKNYKNMAAYSTKGVKFGEDDEQSPMDKYYDEQSPMYQKDTTKTYPPSYTKEDIKFLEEQNEDVVRYQDLDEKGKAIWRKQGKPVPGDTTKTKAKTSQEDWTPAYPGADYSKEEIKKMTEEEKKKNID